MDHPTSPDQSLLRTDGLTKRFGSITAVEGLTIDVQPGVTGLVGANGAGKSTLLKILLGLLPATEGTASVLALDVSTDGPAIRERVGYMPEHDCLPPDVSATEFVVHMGRMSGLPTTAARERAADTLRHVGLYEERYRPMGGYSTGMRQRVKLAQALVHDPALVLLDEPTNGLDPAGRDDMLELIRRIGAEFGISVIVTSHLLGELERVCEGIVVIDAGQLLRHSSTASVTAETSWSPSRWTKALRCSTSGSATLASTCGSTARSCTSTSMTRPSTTAFWMLSPSSGSASSAWSASGTG